MKITTADRFWIVTDPTKLSILEDILYQTDMSGFQYLMRGMDKKVEIVNLTIHTDHAEACEDAEARLAARV